MQTEKGVILRVTKLTETSLIITWCVDGLGIVKTVAKGARRAKSAFAGKLDLFYTAELSWTDSPNSELGNLREIVVLDYAEELRRSYKNTAVAGYFVSLVEYVMEAGSIDDDVFGLLVRALNYLKTQNAEKKGFIHFEKELSKLLGVWDGVSYPHVCIRSAVGGLPRNRESSFNLL